MKNLSGGMKRKVNLGIALIGGSKVNITYLSIGVSRILKLQMNYY